MKRILIFTLLFTLPLHAQTTSDADFNKDAEVGFADFLLFLQAFGNNNQALYNLSTDPYEQNNLINTLNTETIQAKTQLETWVQSIKN